MSRRQRQAPQSRMADLHNEAPLASICLAVNCERTRAIDRLRQRSRQERRDANRFDRRQCSKGNVSDPCSAAQTLELADRLKEPIGELPGQESKAFCLRYLSQISYGQMARQTSRFWTSSACSSMKRRRFSTLSPMRMLKSLSASPASSRRTLSRVLVSGFIVVSQS